MAVVAAAIVVAAILVLLSRWSDPVPVQLSDAEVEVPLAGGSWARTIAEGNIRVELDWETAKLLTVHPTGAGNKVAELDLAGSNPFFSDRFGNALWPQCKRIRISISVDAGLPRATRAQMRQVTVEAVMVLRDLTGLDVGFSSGTSERGEVLSTPDQRINQPDENLLEVHWVDHRNTWLAPDELGTATVWHALSRLGASIGSGRVQLSSRIFDIFDNGRFDEPSRQLSVLHEFAHIFGVGHSTDPNSFMHASLGTVAWITPADRAALALAGSRPC
tara:strand:+ start:110 stop:934 length:825 start_codon:yes stop_codon:yes gene_type:complete